MKNLFPALSSVAFTIAAFFSYSQQTDKSATKRPDPVAALCTPAVPAMTCKDLTTTLAMYQQWPPPLLSVQFVIADKIAFEQEKERVNIRFDNWVKSLPADSRGSAKLINGPFAHSSNDSLLFELEDDGRITKVYMNTSGFEEFKGVNAKGQIETKEGSFDPALAQHMTLFAIGYLEGSWDGERRMLNSLSVHH